MTRSEADVAELPTDPGARLRRQRELAGLTEQQVAEQLNLDAGVVTALERDDFAALGAPVFARGHLKRYAALLSVSEDEVLGAYERSRAHLSQPTLIPKAREEMMPVRGRPKWPWLVGGVLAFLLAAVVAAYLSEHGFKLPGRGSAETAATSTVTDADAARVAQASSPAAVGSGANGSVAAQVPSGSAGAVAAGAAAVPPASVTSGTAATDPSAPAAQVPPGQVALQLAFAADSWVEVFDGGGKAVLYDLGKAGTERTVTGIAPLSVTFGNAPAVTVRVNGRVVAPPPPPAGQTVARFSVGPDGSLR